jgi:hypothetical protein
VIRLHDLRHTHATLLLADGVPGKVVSERLGHASATITLPSTSRSIPAWAARRQTALRRCFKADFEARSITRVSRGPQRPLQRNTPAPDLNEHRREAVRGIWYMGQRITLQRPEGECVAQDYAEGQCLDADCRPYADKVNSGRSAIAVAKQVSVG